MANDEIGTPERDVTGDNVAKRNANTDADVLVDATAAPNPYYCPQSAFEKEIKRVAQSYKDSDGELKDLLAKQSSGTLDQGLTSYITPHAEQSRLDYLQSLPSSEWLAGKGKANGGAAYNLTGWEALSFRGPHENMSRLEMIEALDQQMQEAKAAGNPEVFKALCKQKQNINASTSTAEIDNQKMVMVGLMAALPMPGGAGRMPKPSSGGRGIFFRRAQPATVAAESRAGPAAAAKSGANPAAAAKSGASPAAVVGEPVSVANGEYLETWRDFLIPGTLGFDGSRYMGLKLALPARYTRPLGPCQISMFDEVFSNPARGKLLFHTADGKAVDFDRPFNFLPSLNAAFPHLELKAPWLKQLELKDRGIVKHFRQYDDDVYRLEKLDDLNGNSLTFERSDAGWLEKIEGPDGLSLIFDNDAQGQRTRIALIGTEGSELELARYTYDAKGRMREATCAFGMSVHYVWERDRDLLVSWNNLTRQSETHFTYDDDGRVVHTRTNGIWNNDRFDYREGETDYLPGGVEAQAQTFRYDEHENVTAEIDALGGVVAHGYDRHGFRISTKNQNGYESRTRYDVHGNVKELTDPEGRSTVYGWGDNGELLIAIDGAGNKRTYKHDDNANVISEKDAEGHETRLVRDARGRVVETHFPNGAIERRAWDAHNRLASVTDVKGNTSRFVYDAFGRLVETIGPTGAVTKHIYRAGAGGFDTVSAVIRADGVQVTRSFDGAGQLATVTDGEGRMWHYRYGAFGVLQAIVDPKGGELKLATDIEGRVISVTNAVGRVYSFERDAAGRVVAEEDFDGRVWHYARDAAGQIIETVKPDGAKLRYAYDKSGLIKRIEGFTAKGEPEDITRFWYDARGLLISAENSAALVEFERDRNGRIIGESLNGRRIKSRRDAMGNRILREITGAGGSLAQYIRDPLGAVEQMVAGDTEITFKRDVLGRETERRMGGFHLLQRFDAAGQLAAQAAGPAVAGGLDVSRLGWNIPGGGGERSARARPGHIHRVYEYDRAFAPTSIEDGLWGKRQYTYDDNGQLTDSEAAFGSERFQYDEARNLAGASSSVTIAEQPTPYGRAFDETFGSIVPAPKPSGWQTSAGGVVQIARGPKGEKIQLLHDDCGRLIERRVERDGFRSQRWRYRWDAHDRLVGVTTLEGEEWLFRYDAFGRRVSKVRRFAEKDRHRAALRWPSLVNGDGVPRQTKTASDATDTDHDLPEVGTAYLWDGDHMVAEAPLSLDGHIAWDQATHWHFEAGSHRLLAKQLPSGEMLAIVSDHLGTPKEMFDAKGTLIWAADHHVWGAIRTTKTFGSLAALPKHNRPPDELHCPWRFPGQYEDAETGLCYNRHRHYDPLTGQYASPDPIGLAGGDRPQGYVDNPSMCLDLFGMAQTVGRWMSKTEYEGMRASGRAQEGGGGQTFVATSGPDSFRKQAPPGSIYVEFKVESRHLLKGGREDWKKLIGPSASASQKRMLEKQGGEILPSVYDMRKIEVK
ncbi:RHS repeat-associated core domain-containing protein [Agrobacterium vitis]|uniref:RHS repeat protein n=1 Tax=Agrobacterium vitis TaxID=373 RepID=A0AAE2RB56_AGRVI|nr:RHS repeat-associated core domain-containing protein [Agrobacterium vitis]MBF2715071.1 RHS repeat protein [Agrobacterium vitis]